MCLARALRVLCILMLIGIGIMAQADGSLPDAAAFARQLAAAKPGSTVTLPAGVVSGSLTVPAGVRLQGAGYAKTIIDASESEVGITIAGGNGGGLADLTVRGARKTNIQVKNTKGMLISRVRTTGSLNGLNVNNATDARIENVLADNNRYGIVLDNGQHNVVVNCSLVRNASIGLSLPSGTRAVVFNNVIVESATGIYIGDACKGLTLDYNLHFSLYLGKLADQLARPRIGDWQTLSGCDAHSVQFPLTMKDAKNGDFHPTSVLDWALNRPTTVGWGIKELAGVKAPTTDLDGVKHAAAPAVGVYESTATAPRPADGQLDITTDTGIKSAGVFTKEGRLVCYLFHNLPLRKGRYPFWLPARTFEGQPIAAGTYEVRLAESNLQWEYLGRIGHTGRDANASKMATLSGYKVQFDEHGHLLVGQGWSENDTTLRAYDMKTGDWV